MIFAPDYEAISHRLDQFADRSHGRSALFRHDDGGFFYGLRGDVLRPAASVAKVALVAGVYDAAAAGIMDLDEAFPRSSLPPTIYPTVLAAFAPEDHLTLRSISAFALLTSDNPCATLIHRLVPSEILVETQERLGAPNLRLQVSFDDESLGNNHLNTISANEALTMLEVVCSAPQYAEIAGFLSNNLRASRMPLFLPEETRVMHKTGTLTGVANDVGIIVGARTRVGFAFLCEGEPDRVAIEREIGECAADVWELLGEAVDRDPPGGSGA